MESTLRRQIIVCCDGTNNTLTGGAHDTNVLQLHNYFVCQKLKEGYQRILYYDPGVGSPGVLPPTGPIEWLARSWDRASALASGRGVFENVAAAYLFLMRNWRDNGDLIYLFGFSRGAFTVRAVAGMVNLFGIIRPEYEELVPTLVHIYFAPSDKRRGGLIQRATRVFHAHMTQPLIVGSGRGQAEGIDQVNERERLAEEVRGQFARAGRRDAWVHWVGVWDTVESVGLPLLMSRVNPASPTVLGKRFRNVRHALSLDEHRWPFSPRLYEEPGDIDISVSSAPPFDGALRQTLKQRWYPGVHSDIGGGYAIAEAGIANAALYWMIEEVAIDLGIDLPPPINPAAVLWRHDAMWYRPLWAVAGMTLRNMHRTFQPRGGGASVEFKPVPATNLTDQPIQSIWNKRRQFWPAFAALLLGVIFLVASGVCLLRPNEVSLGDPMTLVLALQASREFAGQQLAALWLQGVFATGHRPWDLPVQPGWAMFWNLCFVACWSYLLARVSSRAYASLAANRSVDSTRPPWWRLGFAPMVAVVGGVAEDMCLWVAMAFHAIGTEAAAVPFLVLGGIASASQFVGLAGCALLIAIRWCSSLMRNVHSVPLAKSR